MRFGRAIVICLLLTVGQQSIEAAAQEAGRVRTGTGVVHGVVVTDDTGAPLTAASVELLSVPDSVLVATTVTDERGRFRIDLVREGDYTLRLTSLGYGKVMTERFELADGEVRDLGTLRMPVDAVTLAPIEVSAERTAVTFEADRTAYNMGVMGVEGSRTLRRPLMLTWPPQPPRCRSEYVSEAP